MPIDTRHPREIRVDIRRGKITGITAGLGQGHVQANLAVLPREQAYDFLLFCQRNPRPCPLIEVTDPGSPEPVGVARGADDRPGTSRAALRPLKGAHMESIRTLVFAVIVAAPVTACTVTNDEEVGSTQDRFESTLDRAIAECKAQGGTFAWSSPSSGYCVITAPASPSRARS